MMRLLMAATTLGLMVLQLATLPGCATRNTAEEPLRVVFWAGIEEERIERANIAAFLEAHPGVEVKLESIPDNYLEKLITAFAAGKPPDVLLLDSVVIPAFLDGGVLLDLAPYAAADPDFGAELFFPEVWDIARRGEAVYAYPKDFTPLVVYYNKRAFDAAGVPYPDGGWDWAEFRRLCAELTRDTDGDGRTDRYGTSIYTWPGYNIVWFWQAGSDVLAPEGNRATGYLDSPASIRAMEYFTGLVFDGYAPDPTARESLGGQSFESGLIAMSISGHWRIPSLKRAAADVAEQRAAGDDPGYTFTLDDVGVTALPRDVVRANVIYESGWAVAKDSPRRELAVELAKYLAGPESQRRRAAMGLAISANRAVAAELAADDPREQAFLDEVPYCRAPWGTRIADWAVVEDFLAEGTERVLLGYDSPEEACRRTAELIDAELSMFRDN